MKKKLIRMTSTCTDPENFSWGRGCDCYLSLQGVRGMKQNIKVYHLTGKSETGIDTFQLSDFIQLSEFALIPIISYFVGQLTH